MERITEYFRQLLSSALAIVMPVLLLPFNALFKIPFVEALARRYSHQDDFEAYFKNEAIRLSEKHRKEISNQEYLLVNGRNREHVESILSPSKFPIYYVDVMPDLERDLEWTGRLVNGDAPASRLAGLKMTMEYIEKAWANSFMIGARAAYLVMLACVLLSAVPLMTTYQALKNDSAYGAVANANSVMDLSQADAVTLAHTYRDLWSDEDVAALREDLRPTAKVPTWVWNTLCGLSVAGLAAIAITRRKWKFDTWKKASLALFLSAVFIASGAEVVTPQMIAAVTGSALMIAMLVVGSTLLAAGVGQRQWNGIFRVLVFRACDANVSLMRKYKREALQLWKFNLVQIQESYLDYTKQVNTGLTFDKSPLFTHGRSKGICYFAGHSQGIEGGKMVRSSSLDLMSHSIYFGGSGAMKSRMVAIPRIKWYLHMMKKGYHFAPVVSDDKLDLCKKAVSIAKKMGMSDRVKCIGTRPGDFRVDLLRDVSPLDLKMLLRSMTRQRSNGKAGENFFDQSSLDILCACAYIAQCAEYTNPGIEWMGRNNMRLYSLRHIFSMTQYESKFNETLEMVIDALADVNGQYKMIAGFDSFGLHDSIRFMTEKYASYAEGQKDGISATARQLLIELVYDDAIAEGFSTGVADNLVGPEILLDTGCLKALTISQAKHGEAGRMVLIMLKTMLYRQAREREQSWTDEYKDASDAYIANPIPGPGYEQFTSYPFICDEFQAIATSGDSLSDGAVYNVLRSARVFICALSQDVQAFKNAVGEQGYSAMSPNWRTKGCMRTDDKETLDYYIYLAGSTKRFMVEDFNQYESSRSLKAETGVSGKTLPSIKWNPALDANPFPPFSLPVSSEAFVFAEYDDTHAIDERFINTESNDTYISSYQNATWRQEDKNAEMYRVPMIDKEIIDVKTFSSLPPGECFLFAPRFGIPQVELVELVDELS